MATQDTLLIATLVALGVLVLFLLVLVIAQAGRRRRAAAIDAAGTATEWTDPTSAPDPDAIEFQALEATEEQRAAQHAHLAQPSPRFGPDVVVYDIPHVAPAYRSWQATERHNTVAYTYPRPVERAVYTNDYIRVDAGGTTLKMRTLLAGPEGAVEKPLEGQQAVPARPNLGPNDVPEPYRSKLFPTKRSKRDASVPATGRSADGTQFVQQLQERISRPTPVAPASERAYYDYPGDVHPVEDIEGIGAIYGDKLRAAGIHTTARLCFENAQKLADKVGVPLKTVQQWQAMSELVKVKGIGPQYAEALARSGIDGIAALKRRAASTVTQQVNDYLDSLETTVVGVKITEARVEGWKKAADGMKRVRLKEPEQ